MRAQALPYSDRERVQRLRAEFGVQTIPSLVVLEGCDTRGGGGGERPAAGAASGGSFGVEAAAAVGALRGSRGVAAAAGASASPLPPAASHAPLGLSVVTAGGRRAVVADPEGRRFPWREPKAGNAAAGGGCSIA